MIVNQDAMEAMGVTLEMVVNCGLPVASRLDWSLCFLPSKPRQGKTVTDRLSLSLLPQEVQSKVHRGTRKTRVLSTDMINGSADARYVTPFDIGI